jgi:predicted AlkP superfamily phosphohydrolase/phosphomutase
MMKMRFRPKSRGLGWATAAYAVVFVSMAGGCRREETAETPAIFRQAHACNLKVLVVGIDGATFDIIEPMAASGKLPTMQRLMESGSHAPLRSEDPMLSPAIWTTIATGRHRHEHGILDFVAKKRGTPEHPALVTSFDRQTLAIWNIVSPFQKTVGVVGWWVTWPAEPVRGFLVSDRLAHDRWEAWTDESATKYFTSPPELFDEIKGLVVDPQKPPMEEIDALAEWSPSEREELLAAERPILFHGPSVFKFGYCAQRTYENIALHLLTRGQPDLSMVFLISVDPVCHTFWHHYRPEQFGLPADDEASRRLGRLIPNLYEHNDRYLQELLARVDKDTVVFIVSDHGFMGSGKLPGETTVNDLRIVGIDRREELDRPVNVGMTGIHHIDGVLIAAGGPIVKGAKFTSQPTIADVTPTILALMGLPVAEDMPGRVLEELVEPSYWAAHPIRTIESYEDYIDRAALITAAQADDTERTEYLRALGYIIEK